MFDKTLCIKKRVLLKNVNPQELRQKISWPREEHFCDEGIRRI